MCIRNYQDQIYKAQEVAKVRRRRKNKKIKKTTKRIRNEPKEEGNI